MTDPGPTTVPACSPTRAELEPALRAAAEGALAALARMDDEPALPPGAEAAARGARGALPEEGAGAEAAVRRLVDLCDAARRHSSGPRWFHFVTGGATPAGIGADWLATAIDAFAVAEVGSPLAVELERLVLRWFAELFELPEHGHGVLVTGAQMANFVGLACARQWWGERRGVDVGEVGLAGLPQVPVFTSGFVHASATRALGMLGLGRAGARRLERGDSGALDLDAMRRALEEQAGEPAILVATAGEVNAGHFDPIEAMADLAAEHDAWLHVDGAFGLFARVSPRTRALAAGVERADSVATDAHKWLNVPYDSGVALVRDPALLQRTFTYDAAYLNDAGADGSEPPRPSELGPESSRRARSFATWATLEAYGRAGVRAWVEEHLDLARRAARLVAEAPELELLADVPLCVVCFRYAPPGVPEERRDELNERLAAALLEDGRYAAGPTTYRGRAALRPAFVNWRTRPEDVDGFVRVVRELAVRLGS